MNIILEKLCSDEIMFVSIITTNVSVNFIISNNDNNNQNKITYIQDISYIRYKI